MTTSADPAASEPTPHHATQPSTPPSSGQFSLLGKKRFGPFFWVQFLGAFNDNVFKNAFVILLSFGAASHDAENSANLVSLAGGLFILPFFLFSATAGQLAEKFEKSRLIRYIKWLEIFIMIGACVGFLLGNTVVLFVVLFLLGLQSALFGPVKFAILPQQLKPEELIGGNALVEMGTFLAILLGTILGAVMIGVPGHGAWISGVTVIGLAALGYLASRGIPKAPAAAPHLSVNYNILSQTIATIRLTTEDRKIFYSVLGISWFWFFGSIYMLQLPDFTKLFLHGDASVVTLLLALFSVGIGLGSLLCERLSGHRVELGLVPFGSIGMTLFSLDMFFAIPQAAELTQSAMQLIQTPSYYRVFFDLMGVGIFGGFYIVPLNALIQQESPEDKRSRIIAGNNIVNAGLMVIASVFSVVTLNVLGWNILQLFLAVAILNALVAVYIYTLIPEFLMRFIVWILIHTLYRLDARHLEHIPDRGPAVLVCNHVSFADAVILSGLVRRPIRFVMDHRIFKIPVLGFVFRTARAIPIAPFKEDPERMEKAFEEVAQALTDGDLVCIFPEGKITYDGEINPFRPGIERILSTTPVPVIPMALKGLWGSFFSRKDGPAMRRFPRRFYPRVELVATHPVPPAQASAKHLEACVRALRGDVL